MDVGQSIGPEAWDWVRFAWTLGALLLANLLKEGVSLEPALERGGGSSSCSRVCFAWSPGPGLTFVEGDAAPAGNYMYLAVSCTKREPVHRRTTREREQCAGGTVAVWAS